MAKSMTSLLNSSTPFTFQRGSGILLHITSLPSAYGIGDLGPQAHAFADFLARAGQRIWQVLPLNPADPFHGNSPYSSISAFAGNTLLISPDLLIEDGLLSRADLEPLSRFPEERCDFPAAISYKKRLLELACNNFKRNGIRRDAFEQFCRDQASWLDDFSLFAVIKKSLARQPWIQWPEDLRDRSRQTLEALRQEHHDELEKVKLRQYLFFDQWHRLRASCAGKGVQLFGDLAIYVNLDSSDVWAHPGIFKLDRERKPIAVSGVPPDYFSTTGQLWGNPVYRWDVIREDRFAWWIDRIGHCLGLFDILRIDYFRGLVAYWEVPAGETTAINGKWVDVPVNDLFNALRGHFRDLPLVAEDLGTITPDVKKVMKRFRLTGMKVLLFAFDEDKPDHPYLPDNYEKNCLAYTGTHDNNTVRGWFECEASPDERARFFRYLGKEVPAAEVPWEFIRLVMTSEADQVIIPLQDILGLGKDARMNRPSISSGNWEWRMLPGQLTQQITERLLGMTISSGRGGRNTHEFNQ
jgi:4-alpha-glucanotransferase